MLEVPRALFFLSVRLCRPSEAHIVHSGDADDVGKLHQLETPLCKFVILEKQAVFSEWDHHSISRGMLLNERIA